jgi:hypothetical protein
MAETARLRRPHGVERRNASPQLTFGMIVPPADARPYLHPII